MMRSTVTPLFCMSLSLVATAQAQQLSPQEVAAIARPFVDPNGLDPDKAPGLVVGVVTAKGAQTFGFGTTRRGSQGQRPDGETAFQIASVSKALTGLLLAEQVVAGRMRLSDPANRALGGDLRLPPGITLGQLITHRSGLPSMPANTLDRDGDGQPDPNVPRWSPGAGYTRADLARYLRTARPISPPGQRYLYSNLGSGLAALAVQDQLGLRDFDALLRQGLSMPLRLQSTGTNTPAFVRQLRGRAATGYSPDMGRLSPVPFSDMGVLAGAGEVISTADDMLRILRVLTGLERGPLAQVGAEATRPLVAGAQGKRIAYAIDVEQTPAGLRYSKNGSCAGYSAYVVFQRQPAVGVVVLANRGNFRGVGEVARQVLDALQSGGQPSPVPTPLPADDGSTITCPLRVYRYRFAADANFDATFDDAQVRALIDEVNVIWAQAGIQFDLGSIEDRVISTAELASVTDLDTNAEFRDALIQLAPSSVASQRQWTLVLMRKMPVSAGGYYEAKSGTAYYAELNPRGNHHPEICAHELGHSLLGAGHTTEQTNVMIGGSPDPSQARTLTPEQIDVARSQAAVGPHLR